jgi:hypothetical protein
MYRVDCMLKLFDSMDTMTLIELQVCVCEDKSLVEETLMSARRPIWIETYRGGRGAFTLSKDAIMDFTNEK